MKTIPTFAADGRRLRNYSSAAIERLVSLSMVVVDRGRKGNIKCAVFRPVGGASPVQATAHMGTSYSYAEHLPSGHTAWKHRKLVQRQHLEEILGLPVASEGDLDVFLQRVFKAVPLSCMPSADGQPVKKPNGGVVSIDSYRRGNRPVEFDSQLRYTDVRPRRAA